MEGTREAGVREGLRAGGGSCRAAPLPGQRRPPPGGSYLPVMVAERAEPGPPRDPRGLRRRRRRPPSALPQVRAERGDAQKRPGAAPPAAQPSPARPSHPSGRWGPRPESWGGGGEAPRPRGVGGGGRGAGSPTLERWEGGRRATRAALSRGTPELGLRRAWVTSSQPASPATSRIPGIAFL